MKNKVWLAILLLAASLGIPSIHAMGLRSFVVLPVDKGGQVLRLQFRRNEDTNTDVSIMNAALGLGSKQTLLLGLPYRLSPGGEDRIGDLGVLYRYIIWQDDTQAGTRRIGLLGGVAIPIDNSRDAYVQAGGVATFYKGRTEWDVDVLWMQGLDDALDRARYDIAWQYRLSPAVYPEWGIAREWALDLEFGARWQEGDSMVHQATIGLQSIHPQWVVEVGLVQDLDGPENTRFIFSTRIHY